ncbi:universal stress protein [Maribacter arcticus]|uniref:Nucleotide-binding universal stress protein, UspA family n=1 Tax=Maribacter arcticus TaxID=561365 RepID=A0A1T5CHU1_9FLAO|nr:universal stress protein [Maribacter arcticus]SKB59017.1 Nucleotide-binding universal stress protein, UspA family [Maribacter arcticus]
MKHILMPTDFSENSWNAIQYGLSMFRKTKCTFYLFTVNKIPSYTGAGSSVRSNQEKLGKNMMKESEEDLQELLKRIEKLALNIKHEFVTIAKYANFVNAVRSVVENKKIDLIIMGTKGASGLKKIALGSNTGDVINKVKCPLLAVPENAKYEKAREIAFTTDFTFAYTATMLDTLKELATLNDATLRMLYISKKEEKLSAEQKKNKKFLSDSLKGFEHSFHTLTNTKLAAAVQCFAESRDIDMIAMVAENHNFFERILFKPIVEEISYHTEIPFLVLQE